MALVVNNATVATGMSPVVESALYADQLFLDGVTFSSRFNLGSAGQIQVVKYATDNSIAPTVPGSNFQDDEYTNSVLNINCNNGFQKSQKVPAYNEATMPVNIMMEETWNTVEAVRIGRQKSALAVLIEGAGIEVDDGAVITKDNVKSEILAGRTKLRTKNANPNVIIASVDVYTAMLEEAGGSFTPATNEQVVTTGRVGVWMGYTWVESTQIGQTGASFTYLDGEGEAQVVDASGVNFIMYDFNAFSIIDKLDLLRVRDSEMFAGSKIQLELASGFKVTNSDCVLVNKTV